MSANKLTQWRAPRRLHLSDVQPHPGAHCVQNVELPLLLTKLSKSERRKHVETALNVVGSANA